MIESYLGAPARRERMSPLLQVAGLHCAYGADEIIHGVDVDVSPRARS